MELKFESRIVGEFDGFDDGKIFELDNGTKWEQVRYKYRYVYKYRPRVKIWYDGRYHLEVEGVSEMIQVRRID